MKSEESLVPQREGAATNIQPANLLEAIVQVATTPGISIDVIERMVALQERQESRQRETAFWAALARAQAKMPLIHRGGRNDFLKTTYARPEDIWVVVQPILAEEGFALTFDEIPGAPAGQRTFSLKLSHREGHSDSKSMTVPIDEAAKNRETGRPTRTGIQDAGSTASYVRRYLTKAWLNIAETDEDTDGNSSEKITDDQAKDLQLAAKEAGLNIPKFFVFMKVGAWEDILADDLKKAVNAIEVRRQENATAAK